MAMDTSDKVVWLIVGSVLMAIVALEYDRFLNTTKKGHPEAGLDIDRLLIHYGYPVEIHEVVTEDGYIITLHRIPHGRDGNHTSSETDEDSKVRPPVILSHCLTCAAVDFVSSGADRSLATLLADNGYDVWLFNARGTTWSRKHSSLHPDKDAEKYWDFSWHHIGLYDIPESIDYILGTTKQESLYYVGMSQGVTSFFVTLSEKPEYNGKIRLMVAMAPAVIFDQPKSVMLRFLVAVRKYYQWNREYFGKYEYFSRTGKSAHYMKIFCDKNSWFVNICISAPGILSGFNLKELDLDRLPVVFSNTPAGCSSKQIEHYLQILSSGNFAKFDFGAEKNLELYKNNNPPLYDVSRATVAIALFYSEGDGVLHTTGVRKLSKILPNVVKEYIVPDKNFAHNDFLYAVNIREKVYSTILEELKKR